jgi:hypothetical protein
MPKRIYDLTQLLNSLIKKPKHLCLLDCVGFFTEGNKFILVFEVPSSPSMPSTPLIPTSTVLTVDAQKAAIPTLNSSNQKSKVLSLLQLLDPNLTEIASLSYHFRVAHKIAQAVTSTYARGWMHKGIKSQNIRFFGTEDSINLGRAKLPQSIRISWSLPISVDFPTLVLTKAGLSQMRRTLRTFISTQRISRPHWRDIRHLTTFTLLVLSLLRLQGGHQ